jgi:cobalamin biosynthesis protein CobW
LAKDLAALEAQRKADPNLDHETPLQELFEDQLACADLVVLNKSDLMTEEELQQVQALVQAELPRAVKMVVHGRNDGNLPNDLLLGFNAAVEDHLADRPSHHDAEDDHDHDEEIDSTHIVLDASFDPVLLREGLETIVLEQEVYRVKGFVSVPDKAMRLVVQGVGSRFEDFYDRPWKPEEPRLTKLVFIGKRLNRSQIETRLLAIG